jgi:hypothetical protein
MSEDGSYTPYVVCQGDHLRKIAFRFGVDADALWSDAKNADLRSRRGNGDVLMPGDVLQVPTCAPPGLKVRAGPKNAYRADVPLVTIRLVLQPGRRSYGDQPFVVHGAGTGGRPLRGRTGPKGEVSFDVPVNARALVLSLPVLGLSVPIQMGDLDPLDERSGVVQRLQQLRCLPHAGATDDEKLAEGVRRFQASQGLPVTGVLDEDTRRSIGDAHGA